MAGISVTWYTAMEQGRDIHVSRQALQGIVRAMRLDPSATRHLFLLADHSVPPWGAPVPETGAIRLSKRREADLVAFLEQISPIPAHALDPYWNRVAWNEARCAFVWADLAKQDALHRNVIWRIFTDPEVRTRSSSWEKEARRELAEFRATSAPFVGDPVLSDFLRALGRESSEFRRWWSEHSVLDPENVMVIGTHPVTGPFRLQRLEFGVPSVPGLRLVLHSPADTANRAFLERTLRQYRESARRCPGG